MNTHDFAEALRDYIVTECDAIALEAKRGTEHEQHDGWKFPSDRPTRIDCGCGTTLIEARSIPKDSYTAEVWVEGGTR